MHRAFFEFGEAGGTVYQRRGGRRMPTEAKTWDQAPREAADHGRGTVCERSASPWGLGTGTRTRAAEEDPEQAMDRDESGQQRKVLEANCRGAARLRDRRDHRVLATRSGACWELNPGFQHERRTCYPQEDKGCFNRSHAALRRYSDLRVGWTQRRLTMELLCQIDEVTGSELLENAVQLAMKEELGFYDRQHASVCLGRGCRSIATHWQA
eukprot:5974287-Amphidinium_carterae.1